MRSNDNSPIHIHADNDSLVSLREQKKSSLDSDRQLISNSAKQNVNINQMILINEHDEFEISIEERAALLKKDQLNFNYYQNIKGKNDLSSGLATVREYDQSNEKAFTSQQITSSQKQSISYIQSENEKTQDIKSNKLNLIQQKQYQQLTNQYNEDDQVNILSGFKEGIQKKVANLIQFNLLQGTIQDKLNQQLADSNKFSKKSHAQANQNKIITQQKLQNLLDQCEPDSPKRLQFERQEENDGFFYHFKIIAMHNSKCMVAQSLKITSRKFMLKLLSNETINLYRIKQLWKEGEQLNSQTQKLPDGFVGFDIVKDWALLPPQLVSQNFQPCYGVLKVKSNYFIVCDLIEDFVTIPFQKANLNIKDRNYFFNRFIRNSSNPSGQKAKSQVYIVPNNMYDQIKQMNLGNISNFENIPIFYVKILIEYIIHISRAFAYLHQHKVVHGAFNLSKVVIQKKEFKQSKSLKNKIMNSLRQQFQGQIETKNKNKKTEDSDSSNNVEQPNEQAFEDIFNANFVLINFEPWIVESLKKRFEIDNDFFKDLLNSDFLKLSIKEFLQIAKIFDLQAFGQSIIEIMVGKGKESKKKVQIDSIPLKWSKLPEIQKIFEILHMCVGPYDFNNNIQDVNTTKVFLNINKISSDLLDQLNQREKMNTENNNEIRELDKIQQQPSQKHINRLLSSQLNNLAAMMYFQLSDRINEEVRNIVLSKIGQTLQDSIEASQDNAVAHLNFMLYKWSTGQIRDEEVLDFIMNKLYSKDQNAARLMFILFKNHVMGYQVEQKEILEHLEIIMYNFEFLSNLAMNLLEHKTFSKEIIDFKDKQLETKENEDFSKDSVSSRVQLLDQFDQFQDEKLYSITIENDNSTFKGQKFFFSNNENYVGFVGLKQFIIIDSRSGYVVAKESLPEQLEQQQNLLSDNTDGREDTSLQHQTYNQLLSDDDKNMNDKFSGSRQQSEMEELKRKRSYSSSNSSNEESNIHQVLMPLIISPSNEHTPESMRDKADVDRRIPPKWVGDIQNTGKTIAIFDISQQERNKHYKHKINKEEVMLLYGLQTRLQHQSFTKNIYKLDLLHLLDQQEVLNFGFDDFNTNQQCICIQAKDLYLYIIDFVTHSLIKKIDSCRFSIIMKSIFYNINFDEYNQKACQFVKEYIQTQEQQGNHVLLPKLNDKFIAIQIKDTNLIKIFSIEQRRIVRQFSLLKDSAMWLEKSYDDIQDEDQNYQQQQKQKAQKESKKQILSGMTTIEVEDKSVQCYNVHGFLNAFQLSSRFKGIKNYIAYMEDLIAESEEAVSDQQNQTNKSGIHEIQNISIIDISPQGRMVVSLIDNDVLIRVVNHYSKTDEIESFIEQQKISSFLPIYQDSDYNMSLIHKELLTNFRNQKLVSKFEPLSPFSDDENQKQDYSQQYSQIKNEIITAANIKKITSGTIEKACRFFQNLLKIPAIQIKKSDKLIEIQKFYNVFQKHFQLIYESNINPKKKYNKIEQCLQLVKEFHNLDLNQIKVEQFTGISKLNTLQSFKFDRSYEFISTFTSSSLSVQTVALNAITPQAFFNYCATVVNRKVQVYNFINGQLQFEIKIANASMYCRKNMDFPSYKSISFMDSDNLLVFQDGDSRLCVINVKTQIEAFGDKNLKQVNKDITIKIEKLMGEEESVNYDFGLTLDENNDKQDKGSDHSDHTGEAQSSKRYIDFGDKIERIFFCRSTSDSAYVGLISKMRFTIYFLQEDYIQPCEYNIAIDMEYRLIRDIASMGQIISLDFDEESTTFATCSKFGWICFWTYQRKQILKKIKVESKFVDPCNIIKYYVQKEMVICFFSKSYRLLVIKIDGLKNKINELFSLNASPDHSKNASISEQQVQKEIQSKPPAASSNNLLKFDKKMEKKQSQPIAQQSKQEIKKQEPPVVIENDPGYESIDLTQHLTLEEKQQRGDVCQIEIDRQYTFLIVVYEKNYVSVFNLITQQEVQVYGPFNSNKIFIDEMCTYMAILDEYQKKISYFLFNFQHKIENTLGTQRMSQERKSKSQEKSTKHYKLVQGIEVLNEENENEEEDQKQDGSPLKKEEEVKSLEENDASKACSVF